MSKNSKRPRDPNELAKLIADIATGTSDPYGELESNKNPANVKTGREGGLKGGTARAAKLTKKQRSEIARKAALARWKKNKSKSK